MKLLTLFVALFTIGYGASAQTTTTYTNSEGQTLEITGYEGGKIFEFTVTWGVDDEWGCLFEASGSASYADAGKLIYGSDPEFPDLTIYVNEGSASIEPGAEYIGMDCARYGDSSMEKYTLFYEGTGTPIKGKAKKEKTHKK